MEIEKFKKFRKEIDTLIQWTEPDILTMEQRLGTLYQEVLKVQYTEREVYENMISDRKKLYGKLYHKVKYEHDYNYDTKSEIETQVLSNDEYHALSIRINQQAAMMEYIEGTLKNITAIPFQIKEYIHWKIHITGGSF